MIFSQFLNKQKTHKNIIQWLSGDHSVTHCRYITTVVFDKTEHTFYYMISINRFLTSNFRESSLILLLNF